MTYSHFFSSDFCVLERETNLKNLGTTAPTSFPWVCLVFEVAASFWCLWTWVPVIEWEELLEALLPGARVGDGSHVSQSKWALSGNWLAKGRTRSGFLASGTGLFLVIQMPHFSWLLLWPLDLSCQIAVKDWSFIPYEWILAELLALGSPW